MGRVGPVGTYTQGLAAYPAFQSSLSHISEFSFQKESNTCLKELILQCLEYKNQLCMFLPIKHFHLYKKAISKCIGLGKRLKRTLPHQLEKRFVFDFGPVCFGQIRCKNVISCVSLHQLRSSYECFSLQPNFNWLARWLSFSWCSREFKFISICPFSRYIINQDSNFLTTVLRLVYC